MALRIVTRSEAETRRLAARLGSKARPGEVICLSGPLGSGKTTFVQGFAKGAGYRGGTASPTFGLMRQYQTPRFRIYHVDLFRVELRELTNLGIEEWLQDPKGVCLIEWPEAAKRLLPVDHLKIAFEHRKNNERTLTFNDSGVRSSQLLQVVMQSSIPALKARR